MKKVESSGNLDPAVERLYSTPKWVPKDEKNSADSIVCDLPSTTLRWMKKRRKMESDQKVVLSYNRERQLREMFQSLDYTHQGEIDLSALIEAVDYVQEKTKHMKGMKEFHNLKEVFLDMDENGDGTIDFTEFTNGMTGTTQSAFDRATEYDIERLFRFFVEFGELRQREIALKKLNISLPNQKKNNKLQRGSSRLMTNKSDSKQEANLKSYQQFKVLFGNPVEKPGAPGNTGNLTSLSATSNPINPLSPSPGIAIENRSRLSPMSSKTHLRPTSPNAADLNSPGDALNEKELYARPVSPELLKLTRMEKLLDDFILDNNPNPHDPLVNPQLRGSSRAQSRQNPSNPNVTPAISQSVPHSPQKSQHLNISTSNDIGDESPPTIQGFGSSDSSVFLPAATSIATRLTLASSRASRRNRYPNITFDEAYETKRNEYLEIHEKLKASRREEYEALSKHYNDVLFMEQRAMAEKKLLASLQTKNIKDKIAASSARITNRNLLPSLSVSQELTLRSVARKDAVEVMKAAEEQKKRMSGSRASSRGGIVSGGVANVSSSLTLSTNEYFHPSLYHDNPNAHPIDYQDRNYSNNSFSRSREFFGRQRMLSAELRPEALKIDTTSNSRKGSSFFNSLLDNDGNDPFNVRASTTWNISADSLSQDEPHGELFRGFSMPHLRD